MNETKQLKNDHYIDIKLTRKNWAAKAFLGLSENKISHANPTQYLNEYEMGIYNNIQHHKRKKDYLSGRTIAKKVLSRYLLEEDLTRITIKWGVFNQPILVYPEKNPPKFSLTHTRGYSACLVFPQEHPMGIDIESYTHNDYKSVESLLTEKEKLLGSDTGENIAEFYILLWTIKEALSKTLQTGLTVPLEIYEIAEIRNFGLYYVSTFKNFLQYKAISFRWKGNICSIVLPEKTHCDLKLLNAYME